MMDEVKVLEKNIREMNKVVGLIKSVAITEGSVDNDAVIMLKKMFSRIALTILDKEIQYIKNQLEKTEKEIKK